MPSPWPALTESASLKHSALMWQRRLGDFYRPFRSAFLQRAAGLAKNCPCPRDCGCAHEVIEEEPGRHVAVCRCDPWNCDTFAVPAEALELWELSWSRLGRALCACLGLEGRAAETGLRRTRQVGAWSAAAVPVFLTLENDPEGLRQVAAELGARLRRPYILLTPTMGAVAAATLELLDGAGAELVDLERHVGLMESGTLQALRTPGELFTRVTPAPDPSDSSVVERAFALVKGLDAERLLRAPTVVATFSLYCLEGMNVSRIARKFHCSRSTVLHRLELIRQRTGTDPDRFRQLSPHLAGVEAGLSDPRARSIHRKSAIYGEEDPD